MNVHKLGAQLEPHLIPSHAKHWEFDMYTMRLSLLKAAALTPHKAGAPVAHQLVWSRFLESSRMLDSALGSARLLRSLRMRLLRATK